MELEELFGSVDVTLGELSHTRRSGGFGRDDLR
jgi:hypothetical protein